MSNLPNMFLSLDWGTSAFRLRLVDSRSLRCLTEVASDDGVSVVFGQWQQQPEADRLQFYLAFVKKHIELLREKTQESVEHIPLVVSGMATSTLGMIEVGYKDSPFALDGSDLTVQTIVESNYFRHPVYLISGARTNDDAMRGEETQVVGCLESGTGDRVVVLPGTHSKHVFLEGGKAVTFGTYMTGEFFQLLSQKSILANSVAQGQSLQNESFDKSFEAGVKDGAGANLLHASFRVRTNNLFQRISKEQNYRYLSGLLIGAEVLDLVQASNAPVTLVGNERLMLLYSEAFRLLSPEKSVTKVNAADAVIRGQFRILTQQKGGAWKITCTKRQEESFIWHEFSKCTSFTPLKNLYMSTQPFDLPGNKKEETTTDQNTSQGDVQISLPKTERPEGPFEHSGETSGWTKEEAAEKRDEKEQ